MANLLAAFLLRPLKKRENAKKMMISSSEGIVDERFVPIGGIEQWISIRGENKNNPVILFAHGGPGAPYAPFSAWLRGWESDFTIVQWDQRGSGRTFSKNGAEASGKLSFERLANDGIELSKFLCAHLRQKKIILIGSSAGSLVSLWMIKKCPELFYAYVGADQNSPEAGRVSYQLTRQAVMESGDRKSLARIDKMGCEPSKWSRQQSSWLNQMAVRISKQVPDMVNDLMLPALLSAPDYSMRDILAVIKGMEFSSEQLFEELISFDYSAIGCEFKLPVFMIQGAGDILTPVSTARNYFDQIKAPCKKFVLIKNAGHLVEFANPDQFFKELRGCVGDLIK